MNDISIGRLENISKDFVPKDLQVDKNNPHYFRIKQAPGKKYRSLTAAEIETLVKNNNRTEDWDNVLVSDNFDPTLVHNCEFWGTVRIGNLEKKFLEFHKLRLPVGISDSLIISCDIGDNAVIRNVHFLSHYIIGDTCILFNIDEMITVDNAKFGNGIVKQGEPEDVRVWLEAANENGGRSILAFDGILPADAFLWSHYRDDPDFLEQLKNFTDIAGDVRRGYYGTVGDRCIIKNSRVIKDVSFGSDCYVKGANKLKNLTIQSSADEPTQIGEGVELVNGIVGFANKIFYGVKCVRFVTGRNVQVKYGARLINSFLGANSTISCCEVLNNLLFPLHEQHHNNSFLIAATVQGQSNIAAGATIGSNHNSRAADGEIIAGRGFWPGLSSTFKHNSRFATFTLIAKGDYGSEMNIRLPFSLVSIDASTGGVQIMPGFWFRYNMYALARNEWKFKNRDKRVVKEQNIEMEYMAPDSVSEIVAGIRLLEDAIIKKKGALPDINELDFTSKEDLKDIYLPGMVNKEEALIIKPVQGIRLYKMMLSFHAAKQILAFIEENENFRFANLIKEYEEISDEWSNLGGQLVSESSVRDLINDVKKNILNTWTDIHKRYQELWNIYARQKRNYAIKCWLQKENLDITQLTSQKIEQLLQDAVTISQKLYEWTVESREKDYTNPFRLATYNNYDEMEAVLGALKDNSFIKEMNNRHNKLIESVNSAISKLK